MKSGKANAIWVGVAAFVAIVCLAGGSVIIATFATGVKKSVEAKKEQSKETLAWDVYARKVLESDQLGPKKEYPNTAVGAMDSIAADFMRLHIARQVTVNDMLAAIKYDWVMTPDSLKSTKNVDECLNRLHEARKLTDWLYENMESDLLATVASMEEKAGNDGSANAYIKGFKEGLGDADNTIAIDRKVANALRRNHEALEDCLKALKANAGKYKVAVDGSITFNVGTPEKIIAEYNGQVEATSKSMAEITELERMRAQVFDELASKKAR